MHSFSSSLRRWEEESDNSTTFLVNQISWKRPPHQILHPANTTFSDEAPILSHYWLSDRPSRSSSVRFPELCLWLRLLRLSHSHSKWHNSDSLFFFFLLVSIDHINLCVRSVIDISVSRLEQWIHILRLHDTELHKLEWQSHYQNE